MLCNAMPIRSQEPPLGLPRGCRVPKLWAVLNCFPGPQAGSGKGSGTAGIRTGTHMGSQACKVRNLTTCATAPGPTYLFFIEKSDIQRGGETERKIFCPMIHSPSEPQRSELSELESRSLFQVSHTGAGSQSFRPSSTAFPGHRQGAGREVGPPGLEPAPIWDPRRARRGP